MQTLQKKNCYIQTLKNSEKVYRLETENVNFLFGHDQMIFVYAVVDDGCVVMSGRFYLFGVCVYCMQKYWTCKWSGSENVCTKITFIDSGLRCEINDCWQTKWLIFIMLFCIVFMLKKHLLEVLFYKLELKKWKWVKHPTDDNRQNRTENI